MRFKSSGLGRVWLVPTWPGHPVRYVRLVKENFGSPKLFDRLCEIAATSSTPWATCIQRGCLIAGVLPWSVFPDLITNGTIAPDEDEFDAPGDRLKWAREYLRRCVRLNAPHVHIY